MMLVPGLHPSLLLYEELGLNAWPAAATHLYDGWLLTFAEGFTLRANSVNPLYASSLPLDEKIADCERLYEVRKLTPAFKALDDPAHFFLAEALRAQGYAADPGALVQTLRFEPTQRFEANPRVQLFDNPPLEWYARYFEMSGRPSPHSATMQKMMKRQIPLQVFAALVYRDEALAVGRAILERGTVGLFNIATDANHRNRGFGRALVNTLLAWGQQNGATGAYLQVGANNPAAVYLYESMRFRSLYRYSFYTKQG